LFIGLLSDEEIKNILNESEFNTPTSNEIIQTTNQL